MVGAVVSGEPFPKSAQLARGERRYRRKVASAKEWQSIIAAKIGPCRVCALPPDSRAGTSMRGPMQYHHLVERDAPYFGDDVADNIVPLHAVCHDAITGRVASALYKLAASLTDAEYAYVIGKVGEDAMQRLFSVEARP